MYKGSDITVVIPTAGRRDHEIERSISSVVNQTCKVSEIIVVWDGPQNLLFSKMEMNQEIKLLTTEKPFSGVAVARQIGIEASKTRLIAALDDDDYWVESKIAEQIDSMAQLDEDQSVFVFSKTFLEYENGALKGIVPTKRFREGDNFSKFLFSNISPKYSRNMCSFSTFLFSKELAVSVPFNPSLTSNEDSDFILRIQNSCRIIFIPKPLVHTIVRHEGKGGLSHFRWDFEEWLIWTESLKSFAGNKAIANIHIVYGVRSLARERKFQNSFKFWFRSLKNKPDIISALTGLLVILRIAINK